MDSVFLVIHIITLQKRKEKQQLYTKQTHTHTLFDPRACSCVCFKVDSGENGGINEWVTVNLNVSECMRIVVAMQGKRSGWVREEKATKPRFYPQFMLFNSEWWKRMKQTNFKIRQCVTSFRFKTLIVYPRITMNKCSSLMRLFFLCSCSVDSFTKKKCTFTLLYMYDNFISQ